MTRNLLVLILFSTLFGGCAKPPRQELQTARLAVAQAYAADAHHLASAEYQAASTALRDGEDLMRRGEYDLARETLPFAEEHARRAAEKAREEKTALELRKLREKQVKELASAPKPAPVKKPPAAAKKPEPPPVREASPPSPPPAPPLPTNYTVAAGETLWTIAARKDVYVDALLWPLLYKANRDQIKDPRQIYPGQVLSIPRDHSPEEKEEARETARTSDIFPIEKLMENTSVNN